LCFGGSLGGCEKQSEEGGEGRQMKIALYIEDGLEQIVLTPESDTEKGILGKLYDNSRELSIKRGAFFNCQGGWTRYTPYWESSTYGGAKGGDESTMIVLRPAPPPKPHEITENDQ
jgi:hypothetical protein